MIFIMNILFSKAAQGYSDSGQIFVRGKILYVDVKFDSIIKNINNFRFPLCGIISIINSNRKLYRI